MRLGCEGAGCRSEGQARDSGVKDRQGGEARIEGLVSMDRDNDKEKSRH